MAQLHSRGSGRSRRRSMNEINMVPFIDVMLVLLIIFMVTAPMISQGVVDLPSVGQTSTTEQVRPPQLVTLLEDGSVEWRQAGASKARSYASVSAMVDDLRAQSDFNAEVPVVVYADKTATYESVLQQVDAIRAAGLTKVGLGVRHQGS